MRRHRGRDDRRTAIHLVACSQRNVTLRNGTLQAVRQE